jgi:hypothetical protein
LIDTQRNRSFGRDRLQAATHHATHDTFTAISGCSSVGVATIERSRRRAQSVLDCGFSIEDVGFAMRGFAEMGDA